MGEAAARKEIAARLRREIGDLAAAAVGELREHLEQTNKNARALAHGLAQAEKRIDAALATPAAIRRDVLVIADDARRFASDGLDQVEALRLRLFEGPTSFYAGINGRLEVIENSRSRLPYGLTLLHNRRAEQLARLPRWAWLRRRVCRAQLNVITDLIEVIDAEQRAVQRVIE